MSRWVSGVLDWDHRIVVGIASHRGKLLTPFMVVLTRLGDGWLSLGIAAWICILDPDGSILILGNLSLALLLETFAQQQIKKAFGRPRPYMDIRDVCCITVPPDRYSFPSGHTGAAFVTAVIIGGFYGWLLIPLCSVAVAIAISRIYLGAHYPSDVLAGAVLGIVSAEFTRRVTGATAVALHFYLTS